MILGEKPTLPNEYKLREILMSKELTTKVSEVGSLNEFIPEFLKYNSTSELINLVYQIVRDLVSNGDDETLFEFLNQITSITVWQEAIPEINSRQLIWPIYDYALAVQRIFWGSPQGESSICDQQSQLDQQLTDLLKQAQRQLQICTLRYRLHLPAALSQDVADEPELRNLRNSLLNSLDDIPTHDYDRVMAMVQHQIRHFLTRISPFDTTKISVLKYLLSLNLEGVDTTKLSFWDEGEVYKLTAEYLGWFGSNNEELRLLEKLLKRGEQTLPIGKDFYQNTGLVLNQLFSSNPSLEEILGLLRVSFRYAEKEIREEEVKQIISEAYRVYLEDYGIKHRASQEIDYFPEYKSYCKYLWEIACEVARKYEFDPLNLKPAIWDRILFAEIAYGDTSFVPTMTVDRMVNRRRQIDSQSEVETEEVEAVPASVGGGQES